ncbi:MAG: hypothetical protein LQ346_008293 [Caloplaca aetnensis]|nr:MAG: hypothetical protein LQ346_008293 [Caloplaca aetnensis]
MTDASNDSIYSDPQPSVSSSSSLVSKESSKKRKRGSDQDKEVQTQRSKRYYSTKYHGLLNDTINDLQLDPLWLGRSDLYPGQVGISRWSSLEKELLFRGLLRYGRDDLPAMTRLIGTKSDLEVHVYLQLLQEANARLQKYGNRSSSIGVFDVLAAAEISEHCCAALEQAADSLASMQLRFEESQERRAHFGLWKLDQNAAEWVNHRMFEGKDGAAEVHRELPAAKILNLGSFLQLSAGLFMNSNEPAGNYCSFASKSEKPSVFHTAFSDLYSITLSLTKRIIQSSLFFAVSRLRATCSSSYSHKRTVKRADVLAALKVLGMKENAASFWAELPRRCKLDVYNHTGRKDCGRAMRYDEVERILGRTFTIDVVLPRSSPTVDSDAESTEAFVSDVGSNPPSSSSTEGTETPSLRANQSSGTTKSPPPAKDFDGRADEYLEYADQRASTQEELRLWEMLGKEPLSKSAYNDSMTRPQHPGCYRKTEVDQEHWRDWTNFKPAWEIYDHGALNDDLLENRRQKGSRSADLARPKERPYTICPKSKGAMHRDLKPMEFSEVDEPSRPHEDESSKHETSPRYESRLCEEDSGASSNL